MNDLQDWTLTLTLIALGLLALSGAIACALCVARKHQRRQQARQEREALRQYREWLARSQVNQ